MGVVGRVLHKQKADPKTQRGSLCMVAPELPLEWARGMPVVAHSVTEYLHFGSNWIHTVIGRLSRYRPVVLCKRTVNLPYFPLDAIGGEVVAAYSGPLSHAYQKAAKAWVAPHFPAFFQAVERRRVALLHSHFASSGMTTFR